MTTTQRRIASAAGALLLLGTTFSIGAGAGRSAATAEFAARPTPAPRIVIKTVTRTVKVPVIHTVTRTIKVPVTKIVTRTVIKTVTVAAPTATSVPEATAAPVDDSGVTYDGVTVAKTQIMDDSNGDLPPDAGKQYVTAHITITNNSNQNYTYNALDFQNEGTDNTRYDSGASDTNISGHELSAGTLAPGDTVAGDVAFEVPADQQSSSLVWTPDTLAPAQYVPLS